MSRTIPARGIAYVTVLPVGGRWAQCNVGGQHLAGEVCFTCGCYPEQAGAECTCEVRAGEPLHLRAGRPVCPACAYAIATETGAA